MVLIEKPLETEQQSNKRNYKFWIKSAIGLAMITLLIYFIYQRYNTYNILESNQAYMATFFHDVNSYRTRNLTYCQALTNFSYFRFDTMVKNFTMSHSDIYNTANSFFVQKLGITYQFNIGEEIFFPQTYQNSTTPSNFIKELKLIAPEHWLGLINSSYIYYGYSIDAGPTVESSPQCGPQEVTQVGVNALQNNGINGCRTEIINNTDWLVIELSNACPT